MADNRKFLDYTGLVKLVEGLNTRYEALYFHKADFSAENMVFQHDNLNGGKDTNVKEALKVLVDNVVRQVNDAAVLENNMQAVETKVDANAAAIAAINNADNGILAQAKADAKAKDDAIVTAQALVDQTQDQRLAALEAVVEVGEGVESVDDKLTAVESAAKGYADAQDAVLKEQLQAEIDADVKVEKERAMAAEAAIREEFAAADTALEGKINDALDDKADQQSLEDAIADLQGEIDGDVAAEAALRETADNALDQRLQAVEDAIGDGGALEARVATAEGEIDVLQQTVAKLDGDVNTAGSVKKQIADAISEVNSDAEALEARVKANEDAIVIINGADTVEGSIAKAEKDAKAYADQQITALVNGAPDAMNTLKELADAIDAHQDVYEGYVNTVNGQIATAKQEAIDAAAADAAAKDTALHTAISAEIDTDVKAEADRAKAEEADIRADFAAADAALKAELQAEIDADVKVEADRAKGVEQGLQAAIDALEALHAENGAVDQKVAAATQAAANAQAAADKAQGEVDALEEVVGDIADGETVAGLIADNAAAAQDAQDAADAAQADVDALEAIVGKAAAGEEAATGLFAAIAAVQDDVDQNEADCDAAIAAEEARAKAAEKANADAIAAIKDGATMDSFADVEAEFNKFGALTDDEVTAAISEAFGTQA